MFLLLLLCRSDESLYSLFVSFRSYVSAIFSYRSVAGQVWHCSGSPTAQGGQRQRYEVSRRVPEYISVRSGELNAASDWTVRRDLALIGW